MDAKSRANFINSVASGESVPCPKCGSNNKSGSKFCMYCGAEISAPQVAKNDAPAFEPVREEPPAKSAPVKTVQRRYVEPNNIFAQGLPEWSIEPPQVMVRRR